MANSSITKNTGKPTALNKLFDLHIEVGVHATTGEFYAKTVIGSAGVLFFKHSKYLADAACDVICEMDLAGVMGMLAQNPALSIFPFNGQSASTGTSKSVPSSPAASTNNNTGPKKMPSELTQVTYPECRNECSSFDNFGDKKCKNMCQQRVI